MAGKKRTFTRHEREAAALQRAAGDLEELVTRMQDTQLPDSESDRYWAASLPVDPEVERERVEEAHRRLAELESGAAEGIPAQDVFARLRARRADRLAS